MTRSVSKEQANAWMRTVIHPLARAAKIARQRVGTGNYSFRCHMLDFEFLEQSDAAVAPVFALNLRHLRKHLPDVDGLIREYDRRLVTLREACRAAFDWILRQPRLLQIAIASGEERGVALFLAEYAVNGIRELPHHYKLRALWSEHGVEILDLRNSEEGAPRFAAVQNAGDAFLESAIRLDDRLDGLLLELADEHGLPPVDPDTRAG